MKAAASSTHSLSARLRRELAALLLVAILAAPSIWLLAAIPPLWKDVDAYIQVTGTPSIATILQYAPGYCFSARLPILLGYAFERAHAGMPLPPFEFLLHPVLTDTGVFILLLWQHASLLFGSLGVICSASRSPLVRLLLALLWASNPIFYVFAHCVGTETLSLILLLLLTAMGLRLSRPSVVRQTRDWIVFGVLLAFSIMTRHLNAVLAGVLPATFLLAAGQRWVAGSFVGNSARALVLWNLKRAAIAIALGLACLAISTCTLRVASRLAGIPYHQRFGYTFLWRLQFLGALAPETRNQVIGHVESKTPSSVRPILEQLRREFPVPGAHWDIGVFADKIRENYHLAGTEESEAELGMLFNKVAAGFLLPPEPTLLAAARGDVGDSWKMRAPALGEHLFRSTLFFFQYPETMPQCAGLETYRNRTAADVLRDFRHHRYFRQWKKCTFRTLFLVWFASLAAFVFLGRSRKVDTIATTSYATALTVVGLLMIALHCLVCEFQPRYAQPMWALTIVSTTILLGQLFDLLTRARTTTR